MKEVYKRDKLQELSLKEQKKNLIELCEKNDCKYLEEKRDILGDLTNRDDIVGLITSFDEEYAI